jgi:type IV pilus assembly protein PilC
MPFFKWIGLSQENRICKGRIFARSEDHGRQKLQHKQINLLMMRSYKPFLYKKVSLAEKSAFISQMSDLLGAGICLADALTIARCSIKNNYFLLHIDDCRHAVDQGVPLYQACSFYTHLFDTLFIALLRAGHDTGNLAGALRKITNYMQAQQLFKERLRAALLMPFITMFFFLAVATFIFAIIVPRFEILLQSTHASLPTITKIILAISKFMRSSVALWTLIASAAALFVAGIAVRKTRFHYVADILILQIPFVGKIIYNKTIATFLMVAGILVSERVPLVSALRKAVKTSKNIVLSHALKDVVELVATGKSLSSAFFSDKRLHNQHIESLIQVGETTGMLDKLLLQGAEQLQKEVEKSLTLCTTFIQPVLLIILGLLVGMLIIAVYMPLLSLTTSMSTTF